MKLCLYLLLLYSLSTALVEIKAQSTHVYDETQEQYEKNMQQSDVGHTPSLFNERELSPGRVQIQKEFELKMRRSQLVQMIKLLFKHGRINHEEATVAFSSIQGLGINDLENYEISLKDLLRKN